MSLFEIHLLIVSSIIFYPGMFGFKLQQRRNLVQGLVRSMILSGQNQIDYQDQASLDNIMWLAAKFDVVKVLIITVIVVLSRS